MEIIENNIYSAYKSILQYLDLKGEIILDERGSETKEVRNLQVCIKDPLDNYYNTKKLLSNLSFKKYLEKYEKFHDVWYGDKLINYCEQFLDPNKHGFIYTYGERLCGYQKDKESVKINQIETIIKKLKDNQNSRRAIGITWNPTWDNERDEVPCLQFIQFMIRNNKLQITAMWRSHDIFGAWLPNVYGISYVADYVANELDLKVNKITIISNSAHIYSTDFKSLKKYLK